MSIPIAFAVLLMIQGLAMIVDEFYFHRRRVVPRWERIGHPLDTVSVLLVFLAFSFVPKTVNTPAWMIGLMVFSCLFVTKDEWIHQKECQAGEQWLHSVLFLIHPSIFFFGWLLWHDDGPTLLHRLVLGALSSFLIYQVIYWNFICPALEAGKPHEVDNDLYEDLGNRWYEASDDPVALLRAESRVKNPWVIDTIRRELPRRTNSGVPVLDVGCGGGFLSNALAEQGFPVTGVDISPGSLEIARKYDSSKSATYLCADAYHLPFEDGTFDVVTCMDFLEHVERPDEVISEAARVLKKNGIFIFHTFNRSWLAGLVIIKGMEWFVRNTPKHLHVLRLFIKPSELTEYCRSALLSVKEMVGISPTFDRAFIKMVVSGVVPPEFSFKIKKTPTFGYLGYARRE